jgi:recombinational DNA repair ATPase RecF
VRSPSGSLESGEQSALVALAEAVAKWRGATESDIASLAGMQEANARSRIDRTVNIVHQNRLRLAYAVVLARQAQARNSYRQASTHLAYCLFKFHLPANLDQAERMALAETSLRLTERGQARQPSWVTALRRYYSSRNQYNVEPSWRSALGLSQAEALELLGTIRKGLRLPPFTSNSSPKVVPAKRELSAEDLDIPVVRQPSNLRVVSLFIREFRGIAGTVEIDFSNVQRQGCSCLILGDNGVGKSTIVSAIEFACQSRVGRQLPMQTTGSPQLINLASNAASAEVGLTFNDGARLVRSVTKRDKSHAVDGEPIPSAFRLAPMSLQRADIVQFLNSSPNERGKLFIGYFTSRLNGIASPDAEIVSLQERLARLKKDRRDLLQSLANLAQEQVAPTSRAEMEKVLRGTFFEGLTQREWQRRTGGVVPNDASRFSDTFDELSGQISLLTREIRELKKPGKIPLYELQVRRLGTLLGDIGRPMTKALQDVAGITWIESISVAFGELSAVSIELKISLMGGGVVPPESVFSEGLQDLVAVLFFLEIMQAAAARGQARILILDDVMQSVDSTIRLQLLDYLLVRFSGWQLFMTVHDRLWREQLTQLMRRRGHVFVEREIRRWSFEAGPEFRMTNSDIGALLSGALEFGNTAMISSETGRLLDQVSDTLSWTLPVGVTRRQNDRYTLADLWPPVSSKLKKTPISGAVEEVDRWLHLRNLLGAHYNEWAASLSQHDADSFANAVLSLYRAVYCSSCNYWVRSDGFRMRWSCRCGETSFALTK